MHRGELVDELRVLDRRAADHDASAHPPRTDRSASSTERTPPPVCTRADDVGADRLDHAEVRVAAVARGVEIDHVDPARAARVEAPRDRDGIVVVDASRAS